MPVPTWYLREEELARLAAGDPARPFALDLLEKPRAHCRWVHLAVRRHCADLETARQKPDTVPFVYAPLLAARPIRFAREFRIYSGADYGKPLTLLPWQQFVVSQVYGWRKKADLRKRRYTYAYIEVPRKNGKTGMLAPLGLYHLSFTPARSVAQKETTPQ